MRSSWLSNYPIEFVQSEHLVVVGVMVGVKLGDMGVWPSAVVDFSPSNLDLVVSCNPSRNLSVGENSPAVSKGVS